MLHMHVLTFNYQRKNIKKTIKEKISEKNNNKIMLFKKNYLPIFFNFFLQFWV